MRSLSCCSLLSALVLLSCTKESRFGEAPDSAEPDPSLPIDTSWTGEDSLPGAPDSEAVPEDSAPGGEDSEADSPPPGDSQEPGGEDSEGSGGGGGDPEPEPEETWSYNLCGLGASSAPASGTLEDPREADYLPMVDRDDTTAGGQDLFDVYDCAPDTNERGPELVYRFVTEERGDFRAEVRDGSGVDIDLHLLQSPSVTDGSVSGCLGRAHELLELEDLPAGEYWLVADSWSSEGGTEYAGAFELAFEWLPYDSWMEIPVAEGVTWSRMRASDLHGGSQLLQVLEIAADSGLSALPEDHGGCVTVPDRASSLGAIAGINGGYFGSSCETLDLLKVGGTLYSTNQLTGFEQRSLGGGGLGDYRMEWIEPGVDWSSVTHAMGGYPSLVESGSVEAQVEPGVQVYSSTDWSDNPRSAMGLTAEGDLLLAVVDGRLDGATGMTTPALAQWMDSLGAEDALGLDGGGSSTLYVQDCWLDGVVNFPSDNGQRDHEGARSVGSGLYRRGDLPWRWSALSRRSRRRRRWFSSQGTPSGICCRARRQRPWRGTGSPARTV